MCCVENLSNANQCNRKHVIYLAYKTSHLDYTEDQFFYICKYFSYLVDKIENIDTA